MMDRDNLTVKKCACCDKFLAGPYTQEFFMHVHHVVHHNPEPVYVLLHRRRLLHQSPVRSADPGSTATTFCIRPEKPTEAIDMKLFKELNIPQEDIPPAIICPITWDVMREPVILSDGFSYEEEDIVEWMQRCNGNFVSPYISVPVLAMGIRNFRLKDMIRDWVREKVKNAVDSRV